MTVKNKRQIKVVVLCIIVATTFWFFNAMNNRYTTNLDFPLNYNLVSNQLQLVSEVPKSIGINVQGSGWDILKVNLGLGYKPYAFELEKEGIKKIRSANLMPAISRELGKLKVNFVYEDEWEMQVDSIVHKSIELKGAVHLMSENITSLYPPIVTPNVLIVSGPRSSIDSLKPEMTLNAPNIEKVGKQSISFKISEKLPPELKPDNNEVTMEFTIEELVKETSMLLYKNAEGRFICTYVKPSSYAKLNDVELDRLISGDSLFFYKLISVEQDTTFINQDE